MPGEAVSRARAVDEEMVSVKREVAMPRDWWAAGLEGSRGLWELFGRRPASLDGAVCTRLALHSPLGVCAIVLLADAPDPLPRRWRARGHDALSLELDFIGCSLIRLSGPMPAHGCAVDIRPQADGVRMRLHTRDFDALITAPIRGCIAHMKAYRRADGAPLLHL